MDSNDGGIFSSEQPESAAEIARKKVLAVYSSTVESLKRNNSYSEQRDGNTYVASPTPDPSFTDQASYQQPPETPTFASSNSTFQSSPVNQTAVNQEWQQYHSAWQNYYQNYYSDYYAKAAQNYLATEKLKSERIATGKVHKKHRFRRLMPLFAGISVILVFLFLQYNRLIFAPIMAYVSPNSDEVASSIEAVDPTITQAVSPEPRLIIPKLNIDVPVAFGISNSQVDEAMNHGVAQFSIPGADAIPGQVGNLVLSGHSAGDIYSSNPYKFIFSGLERLNIGDLMYINYNSVRYTYQMTRSEVVEPSDIAALIYDTDRPMLTLITCTPLGTSRYRLLITAEQISPAYDATTPAPEQSDNSTPDYSMPANEPSFFENIWNGLFGS